MVKIISNKELIRCAKDKDLKEIVNIFVAESKEKPYLQKWVKKKVIDDFKPSLMKKELGVAIIDEKIAGFILAGISSANKKIVYIDELWVTKKYQGRGISKGLLALVEEYHKKKGVDVIRFTAYYKSKATGFYKKLNYKPSKEVVLMEKKL